MRGAARRLLRAVFAFTVVVVGRVGVLAKGLPRACALRCAALNGAACAAVAGE